MKLTTWFFLTKASAIEQQQKILIEHFNIKEVYTRELEALTQISFIKRFSLNSEVYEKVLDNPTLLSHMHQFLKPLFLNAPEKRYNLNKAFQYQRTIHSVIEEDDGELLSLDEDEWLEEQQRLQAEKLAKYQNSLALFLDVLLERGSTSLKEIVESFPYDSLEYSHLIPSAEIFREILIEFLKAGRIVLSDLRAEEEAFIQERPSYFHLNESILRLLEQRDAQYLIQSIETVEASEGEKIKFRTAANEREKAKTLICSNLRFSVIKEGSHVF